MHIRILIGLCTLCFISSSSAGAQPHPAAPAADTAHLGRFTVLDPGISLGRAVFLFPASPVIEIPFSDRFIPSPAGGWGPAGPFLGGVMEPRADLMSPLRLQMENERLTPLQTVLGAVQLGGVGYLAYRHIKKYGLFR